MMTMLKEGKENLYLLTDEKVGVDSKDMAKKVSSCSGYFH
jgi:hypothetical protein